MNRRRTSYPIRWGQLGGVAILLAAAMGGIVLLLHIVVWVVIWMMRRGS